MQRNNNSIMIFEIIRGGGKKLTGWGKNGPAYFFPGERMGRPILSPGKKLTGGKFRPVTPGGERTCNTWICSQTHICSQTPYQLCYVVRYESYNKTCLKQPLKRTPKIGFQYPLSLYAGQKYCRILLWGAFCNTFDLDKATISH